MRDAQCLHSDLPIAPRLVEDHEDVQQVQEHAPVGGQDRADDRRREQAREEHRDAEHDGQRVHEHRGREELDEDRRPGLARLPAPAEAGQEGLHQHDRPAEHVQRADEVRQRRHQNVRDDARHDAERCEDEAAADHQPGAPERADRRAARGDHLDGDDDHQQAQLGAAGEGQRAPADGDEQQAEQQHEDTHQQQHGLVDRQGGIPRGRPGRLRVPEIDDAQHEGEVHDGRPVEQGHRRRQRGRQQAWQQDEPADQHREHVDGGAGGDQLPKDAAVPAQALSFCLSTIICSRSSSPPGPKQTKSAKRVAVRRAGRG